jgi:integrase
MTDWVNEWFPALDLEPSTLAHYRYLIEVHILPRFGTASLRSVTSQEVAVWEKSITAGGYTRRTARDARSLLTSLFNDAIPRYVQANPAQRRRGKGRKGRRRIELHEQQEKVWPTPLEALLTAERCAALTGRDEDFLLIITLAYTGMRWSEITGLAAAGIDGDAMHIAWKLYELGRFYRGYPKDGSIRTADLPPFLAGLLADHLGGTRGRRCGCSSPGGGPDSDTEWCPGGQYVFLTQGSAHHRRSNIARRLLRPAADGWYPAQKDRAARPVLVDACGPFPGIPVPAWPAAGPGTPFSPPSGRGVTRMVSDAGTGRCAACRRACPRRRDGTLTAHKAGGTRCRGSGLPPGEDLAVASWLPACPGLTPHGFRHGHRTWMDEDGIADALKHERLGHEQPGMAGVYGHVTPVMRQALTTALQARWEDSLRQRAALSPGSCVPLLSRLLRGGQEDLSRSQLAPRTGHQRRSRTAARSRKRP